MSTWKKKSIILFANKKKTYSKEMAEIILILVFPLKKQRR